MAILTSLPVFIERDGYEVDRSRIRGITSFPVFPRGASTAGPSVKPRGVV